MISKHTEQSASSDDPVEDLLADAGPRVHPSAEGKQSVYDRVHATWQDQVNQGRRNRRAMLAGIAASLVAAATLFTISEEPLSPTGPVVDARVVRVQGTGVRRNGELLVNDGSTSDRVIAAGDRLTTEAGARAAISWQGAASLRIDELTAIEVIDGGHVQLLAGQVYFDSGVSGDAAGDTIPLVVETDFGVVQHIGTQFLSSVSDGALEIAVREGQVRFKNGNHDFTLQPGASVSVASDNRVTRRTVAATATAWKWVSDIAPQRMIDNYSTFELLNWIARETGYSIRYRNTRVRDFASTDRIVGLGRRDPLQVLSMIPAVTELEYEINGDELLVGLKEPPQYRP